MMKPVYILSASCISPQQHFEDEGFLDDIKSNDTGTLHIIDPNYRRYINLVAIRRMSKLLKMGISTGLNALEQAGIAKPDAIIAGTGRGSMVDTEKFLSDMIHQDEEALTPTSFIQSTYNSVNGWLAVHTKANGYNQTYVHRGASFELSLLDAQMFLNENDSTQNALVGCFDEVTKDYVYVKSKLGYWKSPINNLDLFKQNNTTGTLPGEGAAFFTISNKAGTSICQLTGLETFQDATSAETHSNIIAFLEKYDLTLSDIDVVICGINGDVNQYDLYKKLIEEKNSSTTIAAFKHLCGEYDTSSGFALWIATKLFQTQEVPEILIIDKVSNKDIKNVLIVNHYILNSTSLILLQQ